MRGVFSISGSISGFISALLFSTSAESVGKAVSRVPDLRGCQLWLLVTPDGRALASLPARLAAVGERARALPMVR
eukprot:jgi/Chrpa1/13354/Chrysochromulina_OHIO_Genome00008124-RA